MLSSRPFNPGRTTPPPTPNMYMAIQSQTERTGLLDIKGMDAKDKRNSVTDQRGQTRADTDYIWFLPPAVGSAFEMLSGAGIGPMLTTERAPLPHREVKLYIRETKVTGWPSASLWLYEASPPRTPADAVCSYKLNPPPLPPPAQEERNAWKHHYCALTCTTVNGRVKVPLKKKKIIKKCTQGTNPRFKFVQVDILTAESNIIT